MTLEELSANIDDARITEVQHRTYATKPDRVDVSAEIDTEDGVKEITVGEEAPHPALLKKLSILHLVVAGTCQIDQGEGEAAERITPRKVKASYEGSVLSDVQIKFERLIGEEESVNWKAPKFERSQLGDSDLSKIQDLFREARLFLDGKRAQKDMFDTGQPEGTQKRAAELEGGEEASTPQGEAQATEPAMEAV